MHFAFYVAAWFKSGGRGERERHIKVHWLTLLCTELCSMFSSVWENEIKKVPFWRNYNCKTISARAQLEEINSEPIQKYLLFALHMPWLLRSAQAENLPDLKFLQQYPSYFDLGSGRNSGGTKWAKFSLRSKHLLEAACCCQYLQSVKSNLASIAYFWIMAVFEHAQCAHICVSLTQRLLVKIMGEECLGRFCFQMLNQTSKKEWTK